MRYRTKFGIVTLAFIIFWFTIFYPYILPWMNSSNIYPLLGVAIYETLFYLTMLFATMALLGEKNAKHSAKFALALFIAYHIFDAVEPPFILNISGGYDLSSSAIISWDYGISYTLHQLFGLSGPTLYYVTNIGFIALLTLILIFIISPGMLGKVTRKIL